MERSEKRTTPQSSKRKACPFGIEMEIYWKRRYDLFSLWNLGIQIDKEGLYFTKPEKIALAIAEKMRGRVVIDALCGVGGIAIALGRYGYDVIAVDINSTRLEMARNNARVYGVSKRIQFIHANIFDVLKDVTAECIILDPDWGGPNYKDKKCIKLSDFNPDGKHLLKASLEVTRNIILCVPVNFEFKELDYLSETFETETWTMWNRTICHTINFKCSYFDKDEL